jgi:hypothetical protein
MGRPSSRMNLRIVNTRLEFSECMRQVKGSCQARAKPRVEQVARAKTGVQTGAVTNSYQREAEHHCGQHGGQSVESGGWPPELKNTDPEDLPLPSSSCLSAKPTQSRACNTGHSLVRSAILAKQGSATACSAPLSCPHFSELCGCHTTIGEGERYKKQ